MVYQCLTCGLKIVVHVLHGKPRAQRECRYVNNNTLCGGTMLPISDEGKEKE
jgi:hypothetical protein